ncbi:bacteriohemerythrin [Methanolobus sp.]|uniref:bacteriohemerythrin n=1 Tax=Methanolobus sp. TaxID=1874737 RepID=UPI0025EFCE26|nr:bacteriohemerythrin [Methanolobus sp.]
MALVTWSDKFSMQIKEIDDQHKVLVRMINELHDAMKQAKGKEASIKIIDKMAEYMQFHFSTEEKYMQRFAYPDYMAHKQEHVKFVEQGVQFRQDFDAGKAGLSYDVMNFLMDWLVNHIQESDKKYAPPFIENGVN